MSIVKPLVASMNEVTVDDCPRRIYRQTVFVKKNVCETRSSCHPIESLSHKIDMTLTPVPSLTRVPSPQSLFGFQQRSSAS